MLAADLFWPYDAFARLKDPCRHVVEPLITQNGQLRYRPVSLDVLLTSIKVENDIAPHSYFEMASVIAIPCKDFRTDKKDVAVRRLRVIVTMSN